MYFLDEECVKINWDSIRLQYKEHVFKYELNENTMIR